MTTLLGHLARFAAFTTQSEVLCTQALAYLLETYEDAHAAFAKKVKKCTGFRLPDSVTWVPEAIQEDGGRPDLEARTGDEAKIPFVKIEAKLGAGLVPEQLRSYEADLLKRNSDESALIVLVPRTRKKEAAQVTAQALGLQGSGPWKVTDGYRCGTAIISWDELFDALRSGEGEQFSYELRQLESMYLELRDEVIAPLASDADLREWRSSETDFVKLVDQVTQRLTTQHRLYPIGTETLDGETPPEGEPIEYRRRYVCPCANNTASCFSIGVRDSFAKWVTPIWMRFHKDTGDFPRIRKRIESSGLNRLLSSGHVWIPMEIPRDVSGERMVQSLIEQAENVLKVAHSTE